MDTLSCFFISFCSGYFIGLIDALILVCFGDYCFISGFNYLAGGAGFSTILGLAFYSFGLSIV